MVKTAIVLLLAIKVLPSLQLKLPENFQIGVATSAFQIEGGWNADGKGASIWDAFTQNRSELILDGSNGNIACDSYHKATEDVALVKNLGVAFYRFSLSWTRILPDGFTGNINQAGVDYYNSLIDGLVKNGIDPMVTIYHWDLPQIMSPLGGWTNREVVQYFANYARIAFSLFGNRVKTWITINEPRLICQSFKGLVGDVIAPFPSGVAEYLCARNILLAHAEAYHIYDKEFRQDQKGEISITLDFSWTEPANASSVENVQAANQWIDFEFGLYAHPILKLDYPSQLLKRVGELSRLQKYPVSRVPLFTLEEKLKVKGTFDFIGINHYITRYVRACEEPPVESPSIQKDGGGASCRFEDPNWEQSASAGFTLVPWGLRRVLNYLKNFYGNPKIYVTENGYPDTDGHLEDDKRINYLKLYLNATLQAFYEDGVNVQKYTVWSLFDNLEWDKGYTKKFGIYYVNFTDPARPRVAKKSVQFVKNITSTREL